MKSYRTPPIATGTVEDAITTFNNAIAVQQQRGADATALRTRSATSWTYETRTRSVAGQSRAGGLFTDLRWRLLFMLAVVVTCAFLTPAASLAIPPGASVYVSNLPTTPSALTIDPATRAIYITDRSSNGVLLKVAPDKTVSTVTNDFTPGSGFFPFFATDIQFSNGAVYTSLSNGELVKIDVATGSSTVLHTFNGFGTESGLDVGGNKIYVTDGNGTSNQLREYDLTTGTETTRVSNLPSASYGLEYDSARNKLYFAASGSKFYRADLATGTFTQISAAPSGKGNFAIDPNGLYLYAIRVGGTIQRITISDGSAVQFAAGLASDDSFDLAFGPSSSGSGSSLYVADGSSILEFAGFGAAQGTVGPRTLVNNGSFENGLTNWIVSDLSSPFVPVQARPNGFSPGYGFFASAATDGQLSATHGFDGNGPGVIGIAQDVLISASKPYLVFDYRLERVMHFLENKAVLCKYSWASSLGWATRKAARRPDTTAMSAMKNGRFALLT